MRLNRELIEIKHTEARYVFLRVRYLVVLVRSDVPYMKQVPVILVMSINHY